MPNLFLTKVQKQIYGEKVVFSINNAMAPTHAETQRMHFDSHLTFHTNSTSVASGYFQPEPQGCSNMCIPGAYRGRKRVLYLLKSKVRAVKNYCLMQVLGTKPTFGTSMASQPLVHLSPS